MFDDFRDAVSEAMHDQGMTATELASRVGIGRAYFYRVMAGDQNPTMSWMLKVTEELGIKIYFEIED